MKTRSYLLIALAAFVAAVTGADVFARMTIAGESFASALARHLEWASQTVIGLVILLVPFAGIAVICAGANRWARSRGVIAIFAVSLAALCYFYFYGFQAAQQAMVGQHWTGAALSLAMLPVFFGAPLLVIALVAASIVTLVDRRPPHVSA